MAKHVDVCCVQIKFGGSCIWIPSPWKTVPCRTFAPTKKIHLYLPSPPMRYTPHWVLSIPPRIRRMAPPAYTATAVQDSAIGLSTVPLS